MLEKAFKGQFKVTLEDICDINVDCMKFKSKSLCPEKQNNETIQYRYDFCDYKIQIGKCQSVIYIVATN